MSMIIFDDSTTVDTPSNGETTLFTKDGDPHWKRPDGSVHTMAPPVFGKNFDLSVFEDYTMTTSGQSWSTYAGLQVPVGKAGTYLVFGYAHIRMNTTSYDVRMRLAKNGLDIGEQLVEELKDSSTKESMPRMLMKKVALAEGDYLDLDFATESTSGTVTVREGSIVMWRVE